MNRRLLVLDFIFFVYLFSGCAVSNTVPTTSPADNSVSIKGFESITLNTPGVMEISQGAVESFEMAGDPNVISSIAASVIDHTLVISSEKNLPTNSSITYKVVVKDLSGIVLNEFGVVKIPALTSNALALTVNGSGRMSLGDIKTASLKLSVKGNGSFDADSVASKKLEIFSPDAGNITIHGGQTNDLTVELGSGSFLGADFKSTNSTLKINGSGSAQVWSVDKLDVTISGPGNVIYFGEPTMNMNISGGGQLKSGGNK